MGFTLPTRFVPFVLLGLWAELLVVSAIASADTSTPNDLAGSYERYGTTSAGVALYWTAYVPPEGGKHPAVLVLHEGGFKTGDAGPIDVAQDLAAGGFFALATEYRLAPPHAPMNSFTDAYPQGIHPPPGQNAVFPVDDGHYPEQTDDIQLAIRTARADPRCDGRVYCVGGSAGASHSVYMAATGASGDDRPDLAVGLSGPYELDDIANLQAACVPNETCFIEAVLNYIPEPSPTDILNHTYTPYLADLHAASPTTYVTRDMPPLFIMCSSNDTGGVDTYQFPDLIAKLDSIGLTKTESSIPMSGQYKADIIPVPPSPANGTHGFAYWSFPSDGVVGHPTVAATVINWLQAGPPTTNPSPTPTPTPSATPVASPTPELLNVSTRANVLNGESVMIGGFIVTGHSAKRVVLRALGPSLADAGVAGVLADPTLELYDSRGTLLEQNNDWVSPLPNYVVVSGLTPPQQAESLIAATLPPGGYTAVVRGANGSTGVALCELYDLAPDSSRLTNISTRGYVGNVDAAMIGGFIVGGSVPSKLIIRALGPSLGAAGITGSLSDPILEVHDDEGSLIFQNDNWRSDQEQQIVESTIPPPDDRESAIVVTLPPGPYTAIVRGADNSIGAALVEVYLLD